MAAIERTAYPRLKQTLSKSEIQDFYSLTLDEKFFIREIARNDEPQLHLLVQLKTFQRLGYFPNQGFPIKNYSLNIAERLSDLSRVF
jgi:hypothetical protein